MNADRLRAKQKNEILLRILKLVDEREGGSVEGFCHRTGIEYNTLYRCFERSNVPKIGGFIKIRDAYGIGIDSLVFGKETKQ